MVSMVLMMMLRLIQHYNPKHYDKGGEVMDRGGDLIVRGGEVIDRGRRPDSKGR